MTELATKAIRLKLNLQSLNERDRAFASDLLRAYDRFGRDLSEGRSRWIGILADRIDAPAVAPVQVSLTRINEMFDRASQQGERRAALLIRHADTEYRLSIAGERSRYPGSITVTTAERAYDARTYLGRIGTDGGFVASRDCADTGTVADALTSFAKDPVTAAQNYGRMTGKCCFCARRLTDPISVMEGYGPTCAERFGLTWGACRAA